MVGLIDETSALKKGDKTPGVARQYLGCVGKVDNGIVTVHLGASRGSYRALLDADLYVPEEWSGDRPRCQAAGIPDDVVHRPKWRIALEQVDRARTNGVHLDGVMFDSEYGKCPEFLRGLDDRTQAFVGDVPSTFSCRVAARSGVPPAPGVKGQPARDVVRDAGSFRSQEWQILRLSRATAEDQVWRVKRARVWASGGAGWSPGTYWLMWACSDKTGEEKFLLSNAPVESPAEALVRVGFRRAAVEHAFRMCKSGLGFTHFEGRNYVALRRHLGLCVAMLGFVAEHTQQLRGKNPQVTAEQVCRARALLSREWLERTRETEPRVWVLEVIAYHQRRNKAATAPKQRRIVQPRARKIPRKPKPERPAKSTVRSK